MTAGGPLVAKYWDRFRRKYILLSPARRASCSRAIDLLAGREASPGLRVKPILPDKYFYEARISGGDRLIFHIAAGAIYFVDIVPHDDIDRYSRRPKERG